MARSFAYTVWIEYPVICFRILSFPGYFRLFPAISGNFVQFLAKGWGRLQLQTPHPHALGAVMTVVYAKLPQISRPIRPSRPSQNGQNSVFYTNTKIQVLKIRLQKKSKKTNRLRVRHGQKNGQNSVFYPKTTKMQVLKIKVQKKSKKTNRLRVGHGQ